MNVHDVPSEIWLQVGHQISQARKQTLRSLSETCRLFHEIFTPLLFSSLRFTSFEEVVSSGFANLPLHPSLRFVKNLTVNVQASYAQSQTPAKEARLYERLEGNLIKCVRAMPNLVSFTLGLPGPWRSCEEDENGLNFIPLFPGLVRTLQGVPTKLRDLTLCVSDMPSLETGCDDWLRFAKSADIQRFVAFANLTSLTLVGEFVKEPSVDAVVSTLISSPAITSLSLDGWSLALPGICARYAHAGGQQLSLKHLKYSAYHERFKDDGWSSLEKLTHLRRLESIELEIRASWTENARYSPATREHIYRDLADPAQFSSLRRLSVDRLDDALFVIFRRVGQSLDFPPSFLTELFFQTVDYHGAIKTGFEILPQKREYWPTSFVCGQNIGKATTAASRQALIDEFSAWKGLRLLHLCSDLHVDRSHLVKLADSLNTNLRELYISGENTPPSPDDVEYGSELDFATRLCTNSRIAYLVVHDRYFRVVRKIGEDVCLEYCDFYTSEAEEAEIFMLYRERMEI